MTVYTLINDTSSYHAGSYAATSSCRKILSSMGYIDSGFKLINIGNKNRAKFTLEKKFVSDAIEKASFVVVNGEGGIDNNFCLTQMEIAADLGKKIVVWNSIWPKKQSSRLTMMIGHIDEFILRGRVSEKYFKLQNVETKNILTFPDFSILANLKPSGYVNLYNKPVMGCMYENDPRQMEFESFAKLSKFIRLPMIPQVLEWNDYINSLETAKVYITGRHHGVYAAICAGIPFIFFDRENHKHFDILSFFSDDFRSLLINNVSSISSALDYVNTNRNYLVEEIRLFKNTYNVDYLIAKSCL